MACFAMVSARRPDPASTTSGTRERTTVSASCLAMSPPLASTATVGSLCRSTAIPVAMVDVSDPHSELGVSRKLGWLGSRSHFHSVGALAALAAASSSTFFFLRRSPSSRSRMERSSMALRSASLLISPAAAALAAAAAAAAALDSSSALAASASVLPTTCGLSTTPSGATPRARRHPAGLPIMAWPTISMTPALVPPSSSMAPVAMAAVTAPRRMMDRSSGTSRSCRPPAPPNTHSSARGRAKKRERNSAWRASESWRGSTTGRGGPAAARWPAAGLPGPMAALPAVGGRPLGDDMTRPNATTTLVRGLATMGGWGAYRELAFLAPRFADRAVAGDSGRSLSLLPAAAAPEEPAAAAAAADGGSSGRSPKWAARATQLSTEKGLGSGGAPRRSEGTKTCSGRAAAGLLLPAAPGADEACLRVVASSAGMSPLSIGELQSRAGHSKPRTASAAPRH
mmetsp:Transcript_2528/g.10017  ORF Transcript_2528/g.10017 Transcript_2528/m.10017 type:complete len:456 (+) Transcript_2528:896-2263(+)